MDTSPYLLSVMNDLAREKQQVQLGEAIRRNIPQAGNQGPNALFLHGHQIIAAGITRSREGLAAAGLKHPRRVRDVLSMDTTGGSIGAPNTRRPPQRVLAVQHRATGSNAGQKVRCVFGRLWTSLDRVTTVET